MLSVKWFFMWPQCQRSLAATSLTKSESYEIDRHKNGWLPYGDALRAFPQVSSSCRGPGSRMWLEMLGKARERQLRLLQSL